MGLATLERPGLIRFFIQLPSLFFCTRQSLVPALLMVLMVLGLGQPVRAAEEAKATVIIVVGAAGEEEYGKVFEKSAQLWIDGAKKGGADCLAIGLGQTNSVTDLDQLKQRLAAEPKGSSNELWLVLLGHGTFDGQEAKFNLRGPDLSTTELVALLKPFTRPVALVDCSSCSAPFMSSLKASNRVVITATRSGSEENYARFGRFLAESIADPGADLDKDGQTSLLEAFLMASRKTKEFYDADTRLATEHALVDDNGDGLGTPADWFRGIRAIKKAKEENSSDGYRAHQFHLVRSGNDLELPAEARARRDQLELAVARLREAKPKLAEAEYYRQLELLLIDMARISETKP